MKLYAHPFSSYCQKVLTALYENHTPFEFRLLGDDPQAAAEHEALWPLRRMPMLVDEGRTVIESSIIIEYLGIRHPGPVRLIPHDAEAALEVRKMDRFFDNYVMAPMQKIVLNSLRPEADRDAYGVNEAGANGPRAMPSALPIAPRRRHCSMRTGATRSTKPLQTCGPTGSACWRAPPLPGPWRKRARIARCFRWGRRTGTEPCMARPANGGCVRIRSPDEPRGRLTPVQDPCGFQSRRPGRDRRRDAPGSPPLPGKATRTSTPRSPNVPRLPGC
jgi:glutathione S-transferase